MTCCKPKCDIAFRVCPLCNGYGVLDFGKNCTECGGNGRGGLSTNGLKGNYIGSGELMYCVKTSRRITHEEFIEMHMRSVKNEHNP